MRLEVPSNASPNQFYLLASGSGIDANSLATTTLIWQGGATAANSIPVLARITRQTGTLALMVGSLRLNTTIVQAISAGSSALMGAAADPIQFMLDTNTSVTVVPLSGNWDLVVGTINAGAATIRIEVWGYRIA